MTGHVIWGDFTSALKRHDEAFLGGTRESFKDGCPGTMALGGYIDKTLRGADKVRVEEHLASCPLCRHLAVELYLVLRNRASSPPEAFMQFLLGLVPEAKTVACAQG